MTGRMTFGEDEQGGAGGCVAAGGGFADVPGEFERADGDGDYGDCGDGCDECDAAGGGGFEVRRRDFAFGPGQDADLVIRSAVGNFDIPRATEADRFYVRMYDGATPPNYSEFSAAVFVNLPLTAFSVRRPGKRCWKSGAGSRSSLR